VTPRHVRALRGTAATFVATIIAATVHTLAGGGAPSPALVVAVIALGAPFGVALIGRGLSTWRLGAVVLAAQALFHVAFAVTAAADPAAAVTHAHHIAATLGGGPGMLIPDAPMLAGHVLGAIATVIGLRGGERMLRALARGIRSVFARVRPLARPATPPRRTIGAEPLLPRVRVPLADLSRRGPPAFVLAAR